MLLISRQNFNTTNNIEYVNNSKVQPYSIFKHYYYKSFHFLQLFLYEYYRVVLVVKHKRKKEKDYKFDDTHTQKKIFL